MCLGSYILVIAADINNESTHLQGVLCLFPPVALQLGCATFRGSFDGITLGSICGIMIGTIPMYCFLAWYVSQVWPSDVGVQKSPFFLFMPSYWKPEEVKPRNIVSPLLDSDAEKGGNPDVPIEKVNIDKVGRPTVQVQGLMKTFGDTTVVNGLTFDMYPNQITALLGHNGAGKTTTINMLTGLLPPDSDSGDATIYGSSVLQNMDNIRRSMGVCPQHDVLFENLTVEEHILFFSQLKGYSLAQAQQEVEELTPKFHLEQRMHHFSHELSGGQRRKLSVAVAISGGSKFIVLDEPTAGMDPLARRELWDLLASLRHGRTMLLTTHYMDEADILGDRVGIMSLGVLQCMGSSQFLKTTFGAGYKLIVEPAASSFSPDEVEALTNFVKEGIQGAAYDMEDSNESQSVFLLPFEAVSGFGPFFTRLEGSLKDLGVQQFGVQITSLEDVFLNVGADHSVTPHDDVDEGGAPAVIGGIGEDRKYESNFVSQVIGICKRKLSYCKNDIVTIPLIFFPLAAIITAAILTSTAVISEDDDTNAIITVAIYVAAFLAVPGSLSEFIVKERVDKLRNVLTVMGCTFEAYWLGSFLADYFLLCLTTVIMFITWFSADMSTFYESYNGLSFVFVLLFNAYLIAFSYISTLLFKTPKTCIIFMPLFILFLLVLPNITITLLILIFDNGLGVISFSSDAIIGALLYGSMILSPHGAMVSGMLAIVAPGLEDSVSGYPNVATTMSCMLVQTVLYMFIVLKIDERTTADVEKTDVNEAAINLTGLDEDVLAERAATLSAEAADSPLRIERLRKVFPPKRQGQGPVVATQDVCFHVKKGEIFGLLGANGAGKTTTLSMLTRHYLPSAGDGFINNHSILGDFQKGATNLGVVTQNNSLWELLSVRDHLKLFARLRGVPEDMVYTVVDRTLDQLELTPHKFKLAGRLSGGMKRKLCVAIALIGDPSVVLLDEPSAGLDPVSRRNLWNVILKTMAHRAVVLTTHSMEEAEALCKRIGIMVQGQLRALGTKQHLKTKFGSGYELAIKIRAEQYTQDAFVNLDVYVGKLFPSKILISDNGGLVTYTIAQEDMQMGKAFTALEADKENLGVEDYSIAQPTLEQVFIRTVEKHTPKHLAKERSDRLNENGAATGSSRESLRRLSDNINDMDVDKVAMTVEEELAMEAFDVVRNGCGCSLTFTKRMAWLFTFLVILFFVLALALSSNLVFTIGIIMFVLGVPFCILCACPCCKPPKDDD